MKRAVEAHITTLQAMFDLFIDSFKQAEPDTFSLLKLNIVINSLGGACEKRDSDFINVHFNELLNAIEEASLHEKMNTYATDEAQSSPSFCVAWSYMEMISDLMNFIRLSREGLWLSHPASLEKMRPYFFYTITDWNTHSMYLSTLNACTD